jgi:chemotaxis methyl-accepting protein methylase
MKRHTPILTIKDEPGTPRLQILTRCLECDITIVTHDIDASKIELARAGDYGALSGEDLANAWLKHIAEGRA